MKRSLFRFAIVLAAWSAILVIMAAAWLLSASGDLGHRDVVIATVGANARFVLGVLLAALLLGPAFVVTLLWELVRRRRWGQAA